jgi:hypothetical protein
MAGKQAWTNCRSEVTIVHVCVFWNLELRHMRRIDFGMMEEVRSLFQAMIVGVYDTANVVDKWYFGPFILFVPSRR